MPKEMSFNFGDDESSNDLWAENEEEDDYDLDAFDDTGLLALASRERSKAAASASNSVHARWNTSVAAPPNNDDESDENNDNGNGDGVLEGDDYDGGDWSGVEWEDADENEENDGDVTEDNVGENTSALLKFPSQGVTIHFGRGEDVDVTENDKDVGDDEKQSSKKKKRPTTRILRDVPPGTQRLLVNVRRSHMLCCMADSMRRSNVCSDYSRDEEEKFTNRFGSGDDDDEWRVLLVHLAHSLVPLEFHSNESTRLEGFSIAPPTRRGNDKSIGRNHQRSLSKPNETKASMKTEDVKPFCWPSHRQLQQFSQWFFQFVNQSGARRRQAVRRNAALGAAISSRTHQSTRRSKRNTRSSKASREESQNMIGSDSKQAKKRRRLVTNKGPAMKAHGGAHRNACLDSFTNTGTNACSISNLSPNQSFTQTTIRNLMSLSPHYDEDPQLFIEEEGLDPISAVEDITSQQKVMIFIAMARSLGWRARYVTSLDPLPLELTVDHPLFSSPSFLPNDSHKSTLQPTPPLSSLDDKQFSIAWKQNSNVLRHMLRLIREGFELSHQSTDTMHNEGAKPAAFNDSVDLVSSGDEVSPPAGASAKHSRGRKDRRSHAKGIKRKWNSEDKYVPTVSPSVSSMSLSPDKNNDNDANNNSASAARSRVSSGRDVIDERLSWVEVLCVGDETNIKTNRVNPRTGAKQEFLRTNHESTPKSSPPLAMRWVPIDPQQEIFDRPEETEAVLAWKRDSAIRGSPSKSGTRGKARGKMNVRKSSNRGGLSKNTKKLPVSYVLAVEHRLSIGAMGSSGGNSSAFDATRFDDKRTRGARFTDVTPRYANAWSRTLRLRGATGKQIVKGGGKCVDKWWATCLKNVNRYFRSRSPSKHPPCDSKAKSSPTLDDTLAKCPQNHGVEIIEVDSSDDNKINLKKPPLAYSSDSASDEYDTRETDEFQGTISKETIPTSKAAFKQHPVYVIPSVLHSQDVLHPDAKKRICGVFKGELVYRRSDVSKALRADKWLYEGRKVKDSEVSRPAKKIKARKKPATKGFKALASYGVSETSQDDLLSASSSKDYGEDDNMDSLYGIWQTGPWSPPYVGPTDPIPTNDYKNVELALLNPGLTHMEQPRLSKLARKLGIPYAPCMLGYEGRGGGRAPTISGIVVHDHNVALLREAYLEWESHVVESEIEERRKTILKRWKRLVIGILTKDRLEREYG